MTLLAVLDVAGDPAPQGSKSAVVRNGKAVLIEGRGDTGRARFKLWRDNVTAAAVEHRYRHHLADPFDGPLTIRLDLYLARPASVSLKARPFPTAKPDLDKLVRAVLDALTIGELIADDARVIEIHARKHYADDRRPGCTIRVGTAELEVIG